MIISRCCHKEVVPVYAEYGQFYNCSYCMLPCDTVDYRPYFMDAILKHDGSQEVANV